MGRYKYVALATVATIVSILLWFDPLPSLATQPAVLLQTQPSLSQVIPDGEPVRIALTAVDLRKYPLSNVCFQLQLTTPAKTPWFTSDFPIVEGTTLLELIADAPSGKLEFAQVMPIRGSYVLKARVTPLVAGAFEPFEQSLQLSVPERFVKYRNAAFLIGILMLAGIVSGWIIGGDQAVREGEVASQPIRLVLSFFTMLAIAVLLFVNISAELNSAHSHGEMQPTPSASEQPSQDLELRLSGDQLTSVGQLATQTVQVINKKTGVPKAGVVVKARSIALEDGKQMFAYQGRTDDQGRLSWKEQFFDGSPHRVIVEAEQSIGPVLRASHEVAVEGIEPPLYIRLISLSYYTGAFVLSLLAGIWMHRRFPRTI